MRIFKFILFLLVVISIFIRCERIKPEPRVPEWSKAIALRNSQQWEAYAVARVNKKRSHLVSIPANIYNDMGFWRESLGLAFIHFKTGKYVLYRHLLNQDTLRIYASYATISDDGDVVEDRFVVWEEENNFVEIESIDTVNMIMRGRFQVTFIRDPRDYVTNPGLPDTMRFTNGFFNLKIEKY
jgi:hypothetical protein